MNQKIAEDIEIKNHQILVGSTIIPDLEFIRVLGQGANGIVLLAENTILSRKEAIKIWLQIRDGDPRDKRIQGINEIRKMVEASHAGNYVASVYGASKIEIKLVSHLEFVDGQTLGQFLTTGLKGHQRLYLASLYIDSIRVTSEKRRPARAQTLCNIS